MFKALKVFLNQYGSDFVGQDHFGNRYFLSHDLNQWGQRKRIVTYKGLDEPSKVPPMWRIWLNYMIDEVPLRAEAEKYNWQADHLPNLTGSKDAYMPKERDIKNYNAWNPGEVV